MNEVQIFSNGNIDLPVKEVDGQIYFAAEQSAIGLGISHIANSGNEVVRWDRVNKYLGVPTSGHDKISKGSWITEPQFYKLAFKASNDVAEKFQDWVATEVLPSIRKHGAYLTDQKIEEVLDNPDTIIKLATKLKEERAKSEALAADNEAMKPKVLFADSIVGSETSILIGVLTKIIKQNGVDYLTFKGEQKPMGQNNLFKWLRENGYLISRKGDSWNTPTQKAMELGLFEVKESTTHNQDGSVRITKTTKVTGKGQQYFINKFLTQNSRSITSRSGEHVGLSTAEHTKF